MINLRSLITYNFPRTGIEILGFLVDALLRIEECNTDINISINIYNAYLVIHLDAVKLVIFRSFNWEEGLHIMCKYCNDHLVEEKKENMRIDFFMRHLACHKD